MKTCSLFFAFLMILRPCWAQALDGTWTASAPGGKTLTIYLRDDGGDRSGLLRSSDGFGGGIRVHVAGGARDEMYLQCAAAVARAFPAECAAAPENSLEGRTSGDRTTIQGTLRVKSWGPQAIAVTLHKESGPTGLFGTGVTKTTLDSDAEVKAETAKSAPDQRPISKLALPESACQLVSKDDVESVFGDSYAAPAAHVYTETQLRALKGPPYASMSSCNFSPASVSPRRVRVSFMLTRMTAADSEMVEKYRKGLAGNSAHEVIDVPGLGDAALWSNGSLSIFIGGDSKVDIILQNVITREFNEKDAFLNAKQLALKALRDGGKTGYAYVTAQKPAQEALVKPDLPAAQTGTDRDRMLIGSYRSCDEREFACAAFAGKTLRVR